MSILRKSMRGDHANHGSHVAESCQLGETKSEMLQEFESECQKALWHVFHVLDSQKTGSVQVSQLKVITSNIGYSLGVKKAEELLNKEDTPSSMQYDAYFNIVKTEVINKQDMNHEEDLGKIMSERLTHVIKSCWTFCNFERNHKSISFTNEHCQMLWRLFNVLSETDDTGSASIPVMLHPEEAVLLFRDFIETTGQLKKEQLVKKFAEEETGDKLLTFEDLLNVFERDFAGDLSRNAISLGLNHLYDTYVLNILKKGMLWKRGYNVKSWKERWFVLTPSHMKYHVSFKEKELKGSIYFDMDCKLEVPVDRPTSKPNRFVIITKRKPYDMSASDVKTKNEWVSAVEVALDRVGKSQNIQKEAARERCRARVEKKRLLEEEEKRRQDEARLLIESQNELDEEKRKRLNDEDLLRARLGELEEERRRREDAEARFQEEQRLRELEQERLRELERIKQELENLLAEERQAKKDEEIVRNLQSRLLEEEFQRREELEQLQHQQQEMLSAEREHRECLESERKEQERLLEQARERLQQLEREQAAAASKMQEASAKLERAEKHRRIMEDKAKLWRTPVGLARPIQPRAQPLLTHRGEGAFCDKDFERKAWQHQVRRSLEMDSNKADPAGMDSNKAVTDMDSNKVCTPDTDSNKAGTGDMDSNKTDAADLDTNRADTTDVDCKKEDTADVDSNNVDIADVDSNKADTADVDSNKVDTADIDTHKADTAGTGSNKTDTADVDSNKVDTDDVDSNKVDTADTDSQKADTADTDSNKAETTDVDSNKADTGDMDSNKADTADMDSQKAGTADVDSNKAYTNGVGSNKADTADVDSNKADTADRNSNKADTADMDSKKADTADMDSYKADTADVDSNKADTADKDSNKADTVDVDYDKADTDNVGSNDVDTAGMDPNRTDTVDMSNDKTTLMADIDGLESNESKLAEQSVTNVNGAEEIMGDKGNVENEVDTRNAKDGNPEAQCNTSSKQAQVNSPIQEVESTTPVDVETSKQSNIEASQHAEIGDTQQVEMGAPMHEDVEASNRCDIEDPQQAEMDRVEINATKTCELHEQLTGTRNEESNKSSVILLANEHEISVEKHDREGDTDEINNVNESEETNKTVVENDSHLNGECPCINTPTENYDQVDIVEDNSETTDDKRDTEGIIVTETETKGGDNAEEQDQQGMIEADKENGDIDKEIETTKIECSRDKDVNENVCDNKEVPT